MISFPDFYLPAEVDDGNPVVTPESRPSFVHVRRSSPQAVQEGARSADDRAEGLKPEN